MGDPVEDEGEDARLRGRHHFFIKIVFNNSGDFRWYDKEYWLFEFLSRIFTVQGTSRHFLTFPINTLQCF